MDPKVRLAVLTFHFTNQELIPQNVPWRIQNPPSKKSPTPGVQFIKKTQNVLGDAFARDLEASDFVLVDAWQDSQRKGSRWSYVLRFVFAPRASSSVSEEFQLVADSCNALFGKLLQDALWQIKGFVNPFFSEGKEVKRLATVSLDFAMRTPKDNHQQKPKWNLRIIKGEICVTPVA